MSSYFCCVAAPSYSPARPLPQATTYLGLGIVDPRDVILRFLGHGRDVILRLLGHGVVTMPARGAMDVRDAVIIVVVLNDLSKRDRGRAGQ